jgi:hypothetical protein
LVRPFVVVGVNEVVEPGLLLKEVLSGRLGGLELEGQVRAGLGNLDRTLSGVSA